MGDEYPRVKLAAVQASPVFLNREATIEKACGLILEAGKNGADVVAFPEGYIAGFPQWFWFHGAESRQAADFYRALFSNALEVPSKGVRDLQAAAKEAGCYVVMGFNEKEAGSMGTLYNSLLYIGRDGTILGKRRKLIPTITERLVYGRGDGSDLIVADADFGTLGALICGEHSNSFARYTMLALGEKIHVALWPAFPLKSHYQLKRDDIDFRVRNHAYEGKIFVISVTGIIDDAIKEIICRDENDWNEMATDGGHSSIIDPKGQFIAGPSQGGETILYADADLSLCVDGKCTHDVIGHYNRFDVFELRVNRKKHKPIHFVDE